MLINYDVMKDIITYCKPSSSLFCLNKITYRLCLEIFDPIKYCNSDFLTKLLQKRSYIKTLKCLLDNPKFDFIKYQDYIIFPICHGSYLDIIEYFLNNENHPNYDLIIDKFKIGIKKACKAAHVKIVEILLNKPKIRETFDFENEIMEQINIACHHNYNYDI